MYFLRVRQQKLIVKAVNQATDTILESQDGDFVCRHVLTTSLDKGMKSSHRGASRCQYIGAKTLCVV